MPIKGDGTEAFEAKRRRKVSRMNERARHDKAVRSIGKKKRKGD